MNGKSRWLDNVFIGRIWRSLKCEDIYPKIYRGLMELDSGVERWISSYKTCRIHQALNYRRPWELYRPNFEFAKAAWVDEIDDRKFAPSGPPLR